MSVVDSHGLGHAHHGEFGGAITEAVTQAGDTASGGHIDNHARTALDHGKQKRLAHVEYAAHVDIIHALEIGAWRFEDGADMSHSGDIGEHVERALSLENFTGQFFAIVFV